ncbi:MAG: hypothetical protein OEX18_05010 [Candidatus Krumholzibacteria bacterium]|nr:hypothetical protein [Candidatus Krumholzibacteria bacterium]MDH4336620.1 hypothetical protein [Candidatus Krumholzibacteria bacterium]MDH5268963.1 hypothetical protein [Candidatus Krumholzibacteria bacterium]
MQVCRFAAALVLFSGAVAAPLCAARAQDALPPMLVAHSTSAGAAHEPLTAPQPARFSFDPAMVASADAAPKQNYLPVLYSLLIPGTGEISMGYYGRGIALVAAEILAWTGYAVYHSDGMDQRDAYESFADTYWNMDKWIDDHPCNVEQYGDGTRTLENLELCGQGGSGSGAWPGYVPYVSRDEDKQHYYENLGKYDWYISGWSDWDPSADPYLEDTALRDQYRAMRGESNDSLDKANEFIWISVVARAFSLAETAIIVHNRRGAQDGGEGGGMALRARPRGLDGGELALEVRFK